MSEAKNEQDLLAEIRARMKLAITATSDSRDDELDDLKFFAGSPDNRWQWPADVLQTRGSVQGQTINARPCLTINKLPQHVFQVTNDQRQNRPAGKVIPVDDKADIEVAKIYDGIVRHIEYASDADVAYDTACQNQVAYGEGFFRILTDYCDDESFDQDIKIGRIRNSFSVYMDPTIQDPTGADAKWCFITQDMLKEDYEREFPNAKAISSIQAESTGNDSLANWMSEETVRVAEYFYVTYVKKTLLMYRDGTTIFKDDPRVKQIEAAGIEPDKTREVQAKQIKWCKTNGFEILESNDWPGKWIPVIRVIGNEYEVDGKLYVSGIVRNAKDAQRMYNYWVSQEAEMLALAPKAPFIGYGGQFEGYEQQWKTANTTNWPYLEVNPDVTDGNGATLPLPQRAPPPLPQTGLIQAKMGASDDIKTVTGQYDASLGSEANERSGKAILARQRQTDKGTYHYVDNLARAVRHGTRQIVDLIPKIYDTYRIARIIGMEGDVDQAVIDPSQQEPIREIRDEATGAIIKRIYNPGVGRYDVCVTTGPSYMTKRQEALEAMAQILQNNPALWPVCGDLFIKNMDWPGAEEMAERFKKTIDPKLLGDGNEETPEMAQARQQMQAMEQQMMQMRSMLDNVSKSFEAQELKVKEYEAETKRLVGMKDTMSVDQMQDVVLGTLHAIMDSQNIGEMPGMQREMPEMQETPQQEMMEQEQQMPMGGENVTG